MAEALFDVFLSYNRADEALVQRLAEQLRSRRLEPWLDRWALTPGGAWQEEIVEGLRSSRAAAVIVGQHGLGDWAREELAVAQDLAAKDRRFRIFMVLLPGAPELSDPGLAFLRTRSWVDLRNGLGDRDGLEDLISAITGVPRKRHVAVASDDVCPYRGLEAFDEEHADLFFGRENDIGLVIEKLKASRFLAVLGPSGSGKSSLVRAGVVPAMRRGALDGADGWRTRIFTPGARPLVTLAAQFTHLFPGSPVQQTLDRLHQDARTIDLAASVALHDRAGDRVLLVVDQFEELFTLCADDEERSRFLDNLLYAATIPGGRVVVIVGMRADFYHRCAAHPDLRALVADQQFLVGPLDADGVRRAIDEPARSVGLELEPGLPETISSHVADRPGVLPLLSHVLLEVWQRRRGTMLTLEAYVASGGVEGALAQRANAVYAALSPAQREIARRVLLRLVQPGEGAEDTRRRAEMGELVTRPEQQQEVEAVIAAMADQRLLATGRDDATGARVVDITHEALIRGWPELRDWINEDREALRAQRHLRESAAEWDRRGRHDDDLYSGARLAYCRERGMEDLNELERAFVSAGLRREARERVAGRRRVRLAVSGVVLGLTVVAVVALLGLRSAANQRDIARSRQLAVEAIASLETDPARGLELATQAYELRPTREAQRALREAAATPGSRVKVLLSHGPVSSATFSPENRLVASAGADGAVAVSDWASGSEPTRLLGHEGEVRGIGFSRDGRRLVSGGYDGTVRVWEWPTQGEPRVMRGHTGEVRTVMFSPDGTRVVSGGSDGTVRVWDWAAGAELAMLSGHRGVSAAAFGPDGTTVATTSAEGTARIWNWAGGGEPVVLHPAGGGGVGFSPDGRRVVVAGVDGVTRVFDLVTGGEPFQLRGHASPILTAAFSADGRRIVTASVDRTIRVWDAVRRGDPVVLQGHAGTVLTAEFSSDTRVVLSAGPDGIRVWDWAAGGQPTVLRGHVGSVTTAAFSSDGRSIVSAGHDATVRVWDWAGESEPIVMDHHRSEVRTAAFSPDGRQVVSAGSDGIVFVSPLPGGEPVRLSGPSGTVTSASFSPDGRRVVRSAIDHVVQIWDLVGGGEPIRLRGHAGVVFFAEFSPDGKWVVSTGLDGTVRVWDWASGLEPTVLRGHAGPVQYASFSPDSTRVASAGIDGTVRVWDWKNRTQLTVLRGHAGAVSSVDFGADGRRLVTAGVDGTVRVWDWASGDEPTVLRGHGGPVLSAAFSPDGKRVASSGLDGTVHVRECPTCDEPLARLAELARAGM